MKWALFCLTVKIFFKDFLHCGVQPSRPNQGHSQQGSEECTAPRLLYPRQDLQAIPYAASGELSVIFSRLEISATCIS